MCFALRKILSEELMLILKFEETVEESGLFRRTSYADV